MGFEDIIDQFHEGEFDPELYFGDYDTFFSILEKRKLMDRLDIEDPDIQNRLLLWLHKKNPSKFYQFVLDKLTDLEMDKDGKIYLELADKSELSEFFCDNRRDFSKTSVEDVLSGNLDYWFDNTTDDVYRDVVTRISPKNEKILREYMVRELANQQIEPETDELQEIAEEQGHPEYVLVDSEASSRIIDNEDSFKFIMNNYLPDLESNLYSIHSNAYGSAYESEMYNNIFEELQEYVDGYGEYYSVPHRFKKDTMTQRFRIPVASNFNSNVLDYLDSGKEWGTRGLLEYWGSYIKIIADDFDCLKVDAPDYPDYSKVDEYMNEIFTDYI